MAIEYHPKIGTLLLCNFETGFLPPEMVKRRPAIVVSPPISVRVGLCTVIPISTEEPKLKMPYHLMLNGIHLPNPWDKGPNWVKADMIYAASFARLDLFRAGRDQSGKRIYSTSTLSPEQLHDVRCAMLSALGLASLTKHL